MNSKLFFVFVWLIIFPANSISQVEFSIGGSIGGGVISGNSPNTGSFSTSVFIETNTVLFAEVYPRISFFYSRDFNAILPDLKQSYLPFLQGGSIKGVTYQYFDSKFFLEETVGLMAVNDRTFSDTDTWEYGVNLSFLVGYDFRNFNLKGFKIGAGSEYGLTFTGTLPKYFSLYLQLHYTI